MDYAIIRLGGKQYRVREGEYLVVDRVKFDEGKTFNPDVLLGDSGVTVTAKVLAHERGPKILIGKYRKRTGYKRHNGFRAATSRIEISLGAQTRGTETTATTSETATKPEAAAAPAAKPEAAAAPGPAAKPEAADDHVKGMPSGYEEMTVAEISEGSKTWNRPMLEAALEYEQAHAARKGAISALESALKAKEEGS
jgi:large subunit ribosomal protein L21